MTEETAMRLFVGLALPPPVVSHLDAELATVRPELPGLRWVPPERWHLTLTFLGSVDVEALAGLEERLSRGTARSAPFQVHLHRGGRFDRRVLWIGVAGDRHHLRRLAERTTAAARRSGLEVEEGRFRPHVTLARTSRPVDLRPGLARLADYTGPAWLVDEVHLVRSRLGPEPRYDTVSTHRLGHR